LPTMNQERAADLPNRSALPASGSGSNPPVRITPTSYDGFVLVRAFDDSTVEVEAILEPESS
jgi:hypothetical protein